MANTDKTIVFGIMPEFWEADKIAKNLTRLFVHQKNLGPGVYDYTYIDREILDALDEFGLVEVSEGAFYYGGGESFDTQKLIDFLAERGITATEEKAPEDELKLTDEQVEYLENYLSAFDDLIDEYIDNPNKPNECLDLDIVIDDTDARMKATEIMWKRYPYLSKAVIYANIFMPDGEDYLPEEGSPSFIYTVMRKTRSGEKPEKRVVIFHKGSMQCHNCEHCNYENENGGMYHVETLCKRHNKIVKFCNPFCEDYVAQKNYFYTDKTTKEEIPYLDR